MDVVSVVLASVQIVTGLATRYDIKNSRKATNKNAEDVDHELQRWLSTFKAFLLDKQRSEQGSSHVIQDLVNKIRDFTFDIEDALDKITLNHTHSSMIHGTAHKMKYKLLRGEYKELSSCRDRIENAMKGQIEKKMLLPDAARLDGDARSSPQLTLFTHNAVEEELMVDFQKRQESLVNKLVSADRRRATIVVVGPVGIGKTFLAKNVYRTQQVKDKFDCRAWIHVSQWHSNVEKLKDDMFKQLCPGSSHDVHFVDDKRYLIVLDDVLSEEDYNAMANALPNNSKGSRIVVTTRNNGVANADPSNHITMNKLDDKEAWKLFCMKAFRDRNGVCPEDLHDPSVEIMRRCEGLPLSIALAGKSLSGKNKFPSEWRRFCDAFDSGTGLQVVTKILKPSFQYLEDDLKSCFLYLSLFPKGYSIKRGRLIRSWIAEGFVKGRHGQSMDQAAETYYLNCLIERNLVQASELEVDSRVRSCTVSNLFHDYLVTASMEGGFSKVLGSEDSRTAGSSYRARHFSVQGCINTDFICYKEYCWSQARTCFIFSQKSAGNSQTSHQSLRGKIKDKISNKMSSISHKRAGGNYSLETVTCLFELLKVLDMQHTPLQDFPKDIHKLVLLRCLNLSYTQVKEVPGSIEDLVYLEILNLKHTLVTKLPKGIGKLNSLLRLLVSRSNISYQEQQGVEISASIASLSSLQELLLIKVHNNGTIKDMAHLTKLRKLRLVVVGPKREMGRQFCESIQKMEGLRTLDVRTEMDEDFVDLDFDMKNPPKIHRLYLTGRLQWQPRFIRSMLDSLVKIVLKGSKLNANVKPLEAFEALTSLMELKMVDYYIGQELVFGANTFKSLKILHIEEFKELRKMVVENNAMPKLEKLTICRCKKLQSAPSDVLYRKQPVHQFVVYDMTEEFVSSLQGCKKAKNSYAHDLQTGVGSSQSYH